MTARSPCDTEEVSNQPCIEVSEEDYLNVVFHRVLHYLLCGFTPAVAFVIVVLFTRRYGLIIFTSVPPLDDHQHVSIITIAGIVVIHFIKVAMTQTNKSRSFIKSSELRFFGFFTMLCGELATYCRATLRPAAECHLQKVKLWRRLPIQQPQALTRRLLNRPPLCLVTTSDLLIQYSAKLRKFALLGLQLLLLSFRLCQLIYIFPFSQNYLPSMDGQIQI